MIRDEKGRFASLDEKEMTDEQKEAICYKSKLLNKYFDSYGELVKAETAFKAEQETKNKALEAKKADAKKVEEAYKATLEARKKANDMILMADKEYNHLRNEFIAKYGAFHMTFNDKDGVSVDTDVTSDMLDLINWLIQ